MGTHQQRWFDAFWWLEVLVGWWVENAVAGRVVGRLPLDELGLRAKVTLINLHAHRLFYDLSLEGYTQNERVKIGLN